MGGEFNKPFMEQDKQYWVIPESSFRVYRDPKNGENYNGMYGFALNKSVSCF